MATDITAGAYGFDCGQSPAQPVIITDPDKGPVNELKPALRELVMETGGNQAFRVGEESQCVGVQYVQLDSTGKGDEYTMPVERIAIPPVTVQSGSGRYLRPEEFTMYVALRDLFSYMAREDQELLAEVVGMAAESEIPDPVVSQAREDVSDLLDS